MKNKFSIDEVRKIARLSALELTEYELKNFGKLLKLYVIIL